MDVIEVIGRVGFAVVFLGAGLAHFTGRAETVELARASGIPLPGLAVTASGALVIGGAILVGLGVWADLGVLLLAAFLLPAAVTVHAFWRVADPERRALEQAHFFKNVLLVAACLVMFVYFEGAGEELSGALGGALF